MMCKRAVLEWFQHYIMQLARFFNKETILNAAYGTFAPALQTDTILIHGFHGLIESKSLCYLGSCCPCVMHPMDRDIGTIKGT